MADAASGKSSDKVVLVTGAASGIGAAAMRMALDAGHKVSAADMAPISTDGLDSAVVKRLVTARCDVAKWEDCQRVVAETVDRLGGLDGLLHFAGIHSTLTWEELDAAEFARLYAVNVIGSFHMAKAAALHMKDHGGGAMVLTGSNSMIAGGVGGHGRGGPAYTSTKGAIVALHRALARSFGPYGIRVNAVSPGSTATAMTADYSEDALRRVGERTIVGRIGQPEEIASVALFLVSDGASYITGEWVNVNGGGSFGL
jgi:NAD(P)-dependent dehydrogenase (short-subunit alcohol dehydrogenase family)